MVHDVELAIDNLDNPPSTQGDDSQDDNTDRRPPTVAAPATGRLLAIVRALALGSWQRATPGQNSALIPRAVSPR